MAWLANPFAYIGINTVIAVMPGIAQRLELSTMLAGFWGSLWCFARLATFVGLWLWPGWHYRFRWLLAAYLALVSAFITILLAPSLPVLVAAQVVFGGAVGLIYYSSLFYSMDSSETKGEHGGIHESVIGLGNCTAPRSVPRRCSSSLNTATAGPWPSPSYCSAVWAAWPPSGGREGPPKCHPASPEWARRPEPRSQNPLCFQWPADRPAIAPFGEYPPGQSAPP